MVRLHFTIYPSRSCTHGSRHIIFCGMRLYKIVLDGQIIYLEPSLGPETEWPIGLIPSKEEKPVLKPLFKRFEDEIKIAESTTQDIVIEDKVHYIR